MPPLALDVAIWHSSALTLEHGSICLAHNAIDMLDAISTAYLALCELEQKDFKKPWFDHTNLSTKNGIKANQNGKTKDNDLFLLSTHLISVFEPV